MGEKIHIANISVRDLYTDLRMISIRMAVVYTIGRMVTTGADMKMSKASEYGYARVRGQTYKAPPPS